MQYNECSQHCADLQEEPLHIEVCTACQVLRWCLVGSGLVARGAKEGDWGRAYFPQLLLIWLPLATARTPLFC